MRTVVFTIGELLFDGMLCTGAARCTLDAAKGLSHSYSVYLVGSASTGPYEQSLNDNTRLIMAASRENEVLQLCRIMSETPCIVICVIDHALISIKQAFAQLGRTVPLLNWNHLAAESYASLPGLSSMADYITQVIIPTEHEAQRLSAAHPGLRPKIAVVRNGIRPPKPCPNRQHPKRIVFVGRRSLAKGYDIWIQSCTHLAEWSSDTTFLSIGLDGNDCDEFTMQQRNRLLSSGRLTEHPYLPPRSVAEIIGSSGAIALPTRRDCFPVCVLEALHLGTPIISSAIDNLREIASSPPALQLCEHNSGRRFAIQISQVLDNPPLADSLRQRGRALSKEQYSYEQCIAGIQAHVDRLMRLIDEQ